jgi:replicative DNA helicase
MARQLKPEVLWVDGAYLVKTQNRGAKRWEQVAEVCEGLKAGVADTLNIPVVASFQFNRQQKKGDKGDLDNIAYSDAVGQISSVILGLGLSDDEGSVENLYKRKIDVLKGRNGEVGSFDINWKFDIGPNFMDFSEIKVVADGDLAFGVE